MAAAGVLGVVPWGLVRLGGWGLPFGCARGSCTLVRVAGTGPGGGPSPWFVSVGIWGLVGAVSAEMELRGLQHQAGMLGIPAVC